MFKRFYCRIKFLAEINPLSANPKTWSNTLKQFVGFLQTNCLSVFDHFAGLALKGLRKVNITLSLPMRPQAPF